MDAHLVFLCSYPSVLTQISLGMPPRTTAGAKSRRREPVMSVQHDLRRTVTAAATVISQRLQLLLAALRKGVVGSVGPEGGALPSSAPPVWGDGLVLEQVAECSTDVELTLTELLEAFPSGSETKDAAFAAMASPEHSVDDGHVPPADAAAVVTGDWRLTVAGLQRRVIELTNELVSKDETIAVERAKHLRRERGFDVAKTALLGEIAHLRASQELGAAPGQEAALLDMYMMLADTSTDAELLEKVGQLVELLTDERTAYQATQEAFKVTASQLEVRSQELEKSQRSLAHLTESYTNERNKLRLAVLAAERQVDMHVTEVQALQGTVVSLQRQLAQQGETLTVAEAERDELRLVRISLDSLQAQEREKHAVTIAGLVTDLEAERARQQQFQKWYSPPDADALKIARDIVAKRSALHLDKVTLERIVAAATPVDDPRVVAGIAAHREKLAFVAAESSRWRSHAITIARREQKAKEQVDIFKTDLATCKQLLTDKGVTLPGLGSDQFDTQQEQPSTSAIDALASGHGAAAKDLSCIGEHELRHIVQVQASSAQNVMRKMDNLRSRLRVILRQLQRDVPMLDAAEGEAASAATAVRYPTAGPDVLDDASARVIAFLEAEEDSSDDDEGADDKGKHITTLARFGLLEGVTTDLLRAVLLLGGELGHQRSELHAQRTAMELERDTWVSAWGELLSQLPANAASKLLQLGPQAALKLKPVSDLLQRATKAAEEVAARELETQVSTVERTLRAQSNEQASVAQASIKRLEEELKESKNAAEQLELQWKAAMKKQAVGPTTTGKGAVTGGKGLNPSTGLSSDGDVVIPVDAYSGRPYAGVHRQVRLVDQFVDAMPKPVTTEVGSMTDGAPNDTPPDGAAPKSRAAAACQASLPCEDCRSLRVQCNEAQVSCEALEKELERLLKDAASQGACKNRTVDADSQTAAWPMCSRGSSPIRLIAAGETAAPLADFPSNRISPSAARTHGTHGTRDSFFQPASSTRSSTPLPTLGSRDDAVATSLQLANSVNRTPLLTSHAIAALPLGGHHAGGEVADVPNHGGGAGVKELFDQLERTIMSDLMTPWSRRPFAQRFSAAIERTIVMVAPVAPPPLPIDAEMVKEAVLRSWPTTTAAGVDVEVQCDLGESNMWTTAMLEQSTSSASRRGIAPTGMVSEAEVAAARRFMATHPLPSANTAATAFPAAPAHRGSDQDAVKAQAPDGPNRLSSDTECATIPRGSSPPAKSAAPSAAASVEELAERLRGFLEIAVPIVQRLTDESMLNTLQERLSSVLESLDGFLAASHNAAIPTGRQAKAPSVANTSDASTLRRETNARCSTAATEGDASSASCGRTAGGLPLGDLIRGVALLQPLTGAATPPAPMGTDKPTAAVVVSHKDELLRRTQSPPHPTFHRSLARDLAAVQKARTASGGGGGVSAATAPPPPPTPPQRKTARLPELPARAPRTLGTAPPTKAERELPTPS